MRTLEIPLATPEASPRHIPAEAYYAIPEFTIYRTYPRHDPGRKSDAEYFAWLREQEPEMIEAKPAALATKQDWIRVRPFFGSMGVAPPTGRISSAPPWIHAGNMDNKELVSGTKVFIPVHTRGALFQTGDGHAAQGNGEVDVTALETSLTGRFEFHVRKDVKLRWPRAETPSHFIAMGFHEDLREAMKLAVRETIDFLAVEKRLSRDDAYMLASVTVDFAVTQVVDGKVGVHAMIPKSIFRR